MSIAADQIRDANVAVGDVVKLVDIGGGAPGLPAVDASLLTGVTATPGPSGHFQIGGAIDSLTLPFTDLAPEIIKSSGSLTSFRGRRGTPGTAGTTTIQLYKNGVAVAGAILSWVWNADAAWALKTVALSPALSVAAGDRLSLALTAAEANGDDIVAEVN